MKGENEMEKRIQFTFTAETTLASFWFDEDFLLYLMNAGDTEEEALKEMLVMGWEEDSFSLFSEIVRPSVKDNEKGGVMGTGEDFLKLVSNVRLVEV